MSSDQADDPRFTGKDLEKILLTLDQHKGSQPQGGFKDVLPQFSRREIQTHLQSMCYTSDAIEHALMKYEVNKLSGRGDLSVPNLMSAMKIRRRLCSEKETVQRREYSLTNVRVVFTVGIGVVGGLATVGGLACIGTPPGLMGELVTAFYALAGLVSGVGSGFGGYRFSKSIEKLTAKYQQFAGEKRMQLSNLDGRVAALEEEISLYDKQAMAGDFIVFKNSQVMDDDPVMSYVESRCFKGLRVSYEYTTFCSTLSQRTTAKRLISPVEVLCVLTPASETLDEQSFQKLKFKTPLLCENSSAKTRQYGFLGMTNTQGFQLYADVNCRSPNHYYDFKQIKNSGITVFKLEPKLVEK